MTNLEELKRLAEAAQEASAMIAKGDCFSLAYAEECASFLAQHANPATILSLIQRVEEAESDAAFLNELYATPIDILQERAHAEGRLAGIEEAAKVADAERSVGWEAAAQMESEWDGAAKTITQAIRALKEKAE